MNKNMWYALEKGIRKYRCPSCDQISFKRYIDTRNGEYLPEQFGRCDHESRCTHHVSPYKTGYRANIPISPEFRVKPMQQLQHFYFIPEAILNTTLTGYAKNTFIQNLLKLAPIADIEGVISMYRIGTITEGGRAGAVTFPFIDRNGNIRAIQVRQFNTENHGTATDFIHSILARQYTDKGESYPCWLTDYLKNDLKVSCLFGEHLMRKYPLNPVALVEAPKTALIATLYYGIPQTPDDLLWLATYSKSSLTVDKCKVLQGRNVVLFPDLNAYDAWNVKAQELKVKLPGSRIVVSDILEKIALETERAKGLDLADYLVRYNYKQYRKV